MRLREVKMMVHVATWGNATIYVYKYTAYTRRRTGTYAHLTEQRAPYERSGRVNDNTTRRTSTRCTNTYEYTLNNERGKQVQYVTHT